ncbi:WYL domain-containing protein [Photobacterium phosphoreum]|uniref:WYL domain-containing protein n=1 Tax=Photobacterium phosphoreum TaxID=659 RepID=UPI0039B03BCB
MKSFNIYTLLVLISFVALFLYVISSKIIKRHKKNKLNNKDFFDKYVSSKNYTVKEQKALCHKLKLNHQIGSRPYDSITDWEKELTKLWEGKSESIEFTYRKYDEKERRKISPTEFGYDGNNKCYIRGICHKSNELRTFKTARIETKIKVRSKYHNLLDWVEIYLKTDITDLKDDQMIVL